MNHHSQAIFQCVNQLEDSMHLYDRVYQKKETLAQLTKMRRELNLGPTILITPMTTIVRDFQPVVSRYQLKAHLVSGFNSNQFQHILSECKQDEVDLIFVTIEQLASEDKFMSLIASVASSPLFVVDQAHVASIYHPQFQVDYQRIEGYRQKVSGIWLFLSHFTSIQDQRYLETLWSLKSYVSESTLKFLTSVRQVSTIQTQIESVISTILSKPPTQMLITSSFEEADQWAAILLQAGFQVGCYHRKVEESSKVRMMEQFYDGKLDVLVTSMDSELGYDHPSIQTIIFTFVPLTESLAKVFVSRLVQEGQVHYIVMEQEDRFEAMYEQLTPLDQRLDELVNVIQRFSDGIMLRDCEHFLNINSYIMEKMFKVLKAYGVIERFGLVYRCVQPEFQHNQELECIRKESIHQAYQDFMVHIDAQGVFEERKIDSIRNESSLKQATWPIRPKKMFPRTTFPSSVIQEHRWHQQGVCMMYPFETMEEAHQAILFKLQTMFPSGFKEVVMVASPNSTNHQLISNICFALDILLFQPFIVDQVELKEVDFKNPYHQVMYAKSTFSAVEDGFNQPCDVILWMDQILDGWATAVYSESLLQLSNVKSVIPLGYQRI